MFSYDVVDKKNVINPVEGAIVKEIFGLYAQDYTAAYIADEMRKRGIRTKKGKYLTEKAIYKMLQNTKYNGKIKHGDTVYDNIYPKIVDDVLWQSVQHIRDGNKHAPGRKKEIFDFILSGKLVWESARLFRFPGHSSPLQRKKASSPAQSLVHYFLSIISYHTMPRITTVQNGSFRFKTVQFLLCFNLSKP